MTPTPLEDLLADGARRLAAGGVEAPAREAESLLALALDVPRARIVARLPATVTPAERERFDRLVARRAGGQPFAYLAGRRSFWTLELDVDPRVLVPRPETELLIELALAHVPPAPPATVLDLGTGSGALALAIARERPAARVVATDASSHALEVARANASRLGLGNVEFRHGDWWSPLHGERFDVVVSNPPYLADDDPHLPALVAEPHLALVSGPTGLECVAEVTAGAVGHLRPGGWLAVEHGHAQGLAVRTLFTRAGFDDVRTHRDLAGHERATTGRAPR